MEDGFPFQYIICHFYWNPNFRSTSQGYNSFIFFDFEMGSNSLESLRCLLQMLYWTKFQNLKGNTCDNARHYRSFLAKGIKSQKSPTSSAHNSFIKNTNYAKCKSIFIVSKRSTTLMLEVFPFGACIIKTEGLESWPILETLPWHVCTSLFKLKFH